MDDGTVLFSGRLFQVVCRRSIDARGVAHDHQIVEHPGAVTILPILDDGRICLIRNFRIAVGTTLWELPAGTLEPGEEPLATARRELTEETGYSAENLRHLHSFWMSPGILRERMHLFVATGLQAGEPRLAAGEQIAPVLLSWDEAMDLVRKGEIQDAKTLVGLLYYNWRSQTDAAN